MPAMTQSTYIREIFEILSDFHDDHPVWDRMETALDAADEQDLDALTTLLWEQFLPTLPPKLQEHVASYSDEEKDELIGALFGIFQIGTVVGRAHKERGYDFT